MEPYDDNNSGRSGRGFSRIWIALIIAAIGLLNYWARTEKNPITGVSQHITITPEE